MRFRWVSVFVVGAWSLACSSGEAPEAAPPVATPAPEAPPPAPVATRCPEDVVFFETWQGEYPGPPVDVKGVVTVPARAEACDAEAALTCTVPVGLYHIWSNDSASFGTIRGIERWKALRATTLDLDAPVPIAAGEVVTMTGYMGEGFCSVTAGKAQSTTQCPSMIEDAQGPLFEQIPTREVPEIQLVKVKCTEGRELWFDVDKALFDRPEVAEGAITEYGKADHAP